MNDTVIKIENLTKKYKIYNKPIDRLKEALNPLKKNYHKDFYALGNVSFEIKRGEAVGIIGKNGAGKSTLLKILTGVLSATSGTLIVEGKVSALLELGTGFNPEYTGIQNIYLNGTMLGFTKQEIDQKLDNILAFADIGDFIHQPVKTYSSGMFARLAFSVAINVDPDILIIDEALAVGDIFFQAKCIARMKEFAKTRTVLFVSHSMEAVKSFCQRGILLDKGVIVLDDEIKKVAETYETLMNQKIADTKQPRSLGKVNKKNNIENIAIDSSFVEDLEFTKRVEALRSGTGEARFIRVEMLVDGHVNNIVPFGANVILRFVIKYYEDIDTEGTIGYTIRNKNGLDVFGMNVYNKAKLLPKMKAGQILEVEFSFKNILAANAAYTVAVGLKEELHHPAYIDVVYTTIVFEVPSLENKNWVPGLFYVENNLSIKVIGE